jgi:ATP-dependent RNA helicase DDX19/DBP5
MVNNSAGGWGSPKNDSNAAGDDWGQATISKTNVGWGQDLPSNTYQEPKSEKVTKNSEDDWEKDSSPKVGQNSSLKASQEAKNEKSPVSSPKNSSDDWGQATISKTNAGWGQDTLTPPKDSQESEKTPVSSTEEPATAVFEEPEDDDEDEYAKEVEGVFMSTLSDSKNDVKVKLADKQADVNSPLYSVKTFEELGLDENLLKGIYAMKFMKPSKVQERALPLLLNDPPTNLIAQSQSGTGKSAAFVLAMLQRVNFEEDYPQAVCIAPTRELARQIMDVTKQMGQYTKCTTALLLREEMVQSRDDESAEYSARVERSPITANVIIGTPGTIHDYERKRLLDLSKVKIFVLDEADVMLDKQGMGMQSLRVKRACPENVQSVFFSATFTESIIEFAHRIAPNSNEITLKRDELSVDAIKQFFIDCESFQDKFKMLSNLYGLLTVSQSIIFVATKKTADQVQGHMETEGYSTSVLHSGLSPDERDRVIDEFRAGRSKVLIATNVLARGIDVLPVNLVVNFDMPLNAEHRPDPETYLHRIGRTGRFGRVGVSINFIHNKQSLDAMLEIQKYFGREIVRIPTTSIQHMQEKLSEILEH